MSMQDDAGSIEIIEFLLCGNRYGISTGLIKEILAYQSVTPVPNAHPSVEGIFMPRDKMITAIDLANCLQIGTKQQDGYFVVTQVGDIEAAFHIDSIIGIHRIELEEIKPIGFSAPENGYTDGAVKINGGLVILLNFENIVNEVAPVDDMMQEDDEIADYEDAEYENVEEE